MSKQFLFITLGFLFLLSSGLAAQTNYAGAIASYVSEHDARVSTANAAHIEYAPVTLRRNDDNEIEVFIDNEEQLHITLQRDTTSDMDYLLPRTIASAVIVLTNETVVIIDQVQQLHFALSLNEQPRLPVLKSEPTLVFSGYGLSRNWAKGL